MISIKVYKQGNDMLVGACDETLLGKKFIKGKFQIDVSPAFYDGERIDAKTLERYLFEATIANLVGKETIACALRVGLINKESILRINGVPHAQMIRMM